MAKLPHAISNQVAPETGVRFYDSYLNVRKGCRAGEQEPGGSQVYVIRLLLLVFGSILRRVSKTKAGRHNTPTAVALWYEMVRSSTGRCTCFLCVGGDAEIDPRRLRAHFSLALECFPRRETS